MFNWFAQRKRKAQLSKLFSENFSPELLEAVSAPGFSKLNILSEAPVEFVFAAVQGATSDETGERLGSVATIAHRSGWMIQDIICNLVVLVHGTLPRKEPLVFDRAELAGKLLQAMGSNIKIVHGIETASFGNMGSSARVTYGVLLPSFLPAMGLLDSLSYGRAQEYRC